MQQKKTEDLLFKKGESDGVEKLKLSDFNERLGNIENYLDGLKKKDEAAKHYYFKIGKYVGYVSLTLLTSMVFTLAFNVPGKDKWLMIELAIILANMGIAEKFAPTDEKKILVPAIIVAGVILLVVKAFN